jgi:hypothetical protein
MSSPWGAPRIHAEGLIFLNNEDAKVRFGSLPKSSQVPTTFVDHCSRKIRSSSMSLELVGGRRLEGYSDNWRHKSPDTRAATT